MHYEGIIIRPPSEANSLILQMTVGCSHNQCSFCPAYKAKKFRIKPINEIFNDIDEAAAETCDAVRRVFLCDGDPLIAPQATLIAILQKLNGAFPLLQRVGIYGNTKSVLNKTLEDLQALREQKLGILYLGLESGDQVILDRIKKGVTADQMIEAAQRVREAGIKLSVTVILGLGGKERSREHAMETMRVLNEMKPDHVGALTLMVAPGTPIHQQWKNGAFKLPEPFELIEELRLMIKDSQLKNCLFFSNHASNYLPLKIRLPQQKEQALRQIEAVLHERNTNVLTPEFLRAL
jgi:radical SAM superfamily enzyme YgiQ (UPF0313 family)